MKWIKVNDKDESTLPPLEKVVAVIWLSNYDDSQVFALGGRVTEDGVWLWALNESSDLHRISPVAELVADDNYRVTHWAEIEWPEEGW